MLAAYWRVTYSLRLDALLAREKNMYKFECTLKNEEATVAMGAMLANALGNGAVVFLHGDLGAGKTTFTRGVIQGFGHQGKVKSPTYTIVEPYELAEHSIYHFDLYRLADPEELEFMGIRDYFASSAICLIEWPEKGGLLLAEPDLEITLEYVDEQRKISIMGSTEKGQSIVAKLKTYAN